MNDNQKQVLEYMKDWLEQEDDIYLVEAWNQVKYAVLDSLETADKGE